MTKKPKNKKIANALKKIKARGIKPERIAYDLNVSIWTVLGWMRGAWAPNVATARTLELLYGVKIGRVH